MRDRLFVPLNKEWYNMFLNLTKTWEIRGVSARFNTNTVKTGRAVELRNGYQKKGVIWGKIGKVVVIDNIFHLQQDIFDMAVPTHDPNLMQQLKEYNIKYDQFIIFEVIWT